MKLSQISTIFSCFLILVTMVASGFIYGEKNLTFAKSTDEYELIYCAADLAKLSQNPDGKYKLANSIDFEASDNVNYNFNFYEKLNLISTTFCGELDGDYYKIKNLTVLNETKNSAGFFGKLNGATIKNIVFENIQINSVADYAGVIAGEIENSVLSDVLISCNYYCVYGSQVGLISGKIINSSLNGIVANGTTRDAVKSGALAYFADELTIVKNLVAESNNALLFGEGQPDIKNFCITLNGQNLQSEDFDNSFEVKIFEEVDKKQDITEPTQPPENSRDDDDGNETENADDDNASNNQGPKDESENDDSENNDDNSGEDDNSDDEEDDSATDETDVNEDDETDNTDENNTNENDENNTGEQSDTNESEQNNSGADKISADGSGGGRPSDGNGSQLQTESEQVDRSKNDLRVIEVLVISGLLIIFMFIKFKKPHVSNKK